MNLSIGMRAAVVTVAIFVAFGAGLTWANAVVRM